MSLKDKAYQLFNYVAQVYSIDLPIVRDVNKYAAELWWLADQTESPQCKIKEFDQESAGEENELVSGSQDPEAWLKVTKRQYDPPPSLPVVLKDWVSVPINPTRQPSTNLSIIRRVHFRDDTRRVEAFHEYLQLWKAQRDLGAGEPEVPNPLEGWIEFLQGEDKTPVYLEARELPEEFNDDLARPMAFEKYLREQWKPWSDRVTPLYKANIFYDDLFSLYQRISVEGDRIEIVWGHVFLSWDTQDGNRIYHPLFITPMNLTFDSLERTLTLSPSQTTPTKLDIECLMDVQYPLREELTKFVHKINTDSSLDVWSNNQMRGLAATITGYLSKEPIEKANLYSANLFSKPPLKSYPVIYNAPSVFVRERMRRLWVDDAKQIASAIQRGATIPPFIGALVADPRTSEMPDPRYHEESESSDEDHGELLLPLDSNSQQEQIVLKLRKHFGALVQGPPGTGKSHSIANLLSSLLARGKRILVTSQTENALRVLRDFIPPEIRSLCVSHLGNDLEAKRQLEEAVNSIGEKLAEKESGQTDENVLGLKSRLREIREQQASLRNKIRDWVEIDSSKLKVGSEIVTALQAAKECSEKREGHSWFPDKLHPDFEPPLTDEQLLTMCEMIRGLPLKDRDSCQKVLPDPKNVISPHNFSLILAQLRNISQLIAEGASHIDDWDSKLSLATDSDLKTTMESLRDGLKTRQEVNQEWQARIIELVVSETAQKEYWESILERCQNIRKKAWQAYKMLNGAEIKVAASLPPDLDIEVALEELAEYVTKGGNPTSFIARVGLSLSQGARQIFSSIKADGFELRTPERVELAKAHFTYSVCLNKISALWNQAMHAVEGPEMLTTGPMPLADVDNKIKSLLHPLSWKKTHYDMMSVYAQNLGYTKGNLYREEVIERALKVVYAQVSERRKKNIEGDLGRYCGYLSQGKRTQNSHTLWQRLLSAITQKDAPEYEKCFRELERLIKLKPKVELLESLIGELKRIAPIWCKELEKRALDLGREAIQPEWALAWRWSRLNTWLDILHNRESVDSLQNKLEAERRKEREHIEYLVKERTWQRQISNVRDFQYKALVAWKNAMKKYGKGTGKYAQVWLHEASKAMRDAVGAVPAWIMPLHRAIQSFPAEPDVFDVVIVDEASQCDLRALSVLFRGKKAVVVGDPEQISPSNIGISGDKVLGLIQHFLQDIPHSKALFDINNSLYHIAENIPKIDRILLTEHFRCVPQIIEFNNSLCPSYNHRLEPLRQPNPEELLEPAIVTRYVETGFKTANEVNEPEAEALVREMIKCCNDQRYTKKHKANKKRTMGVVSLLGENQAKYISTLIAQHLDETERAERKIICGDAYAFQGDERDVMFLSLVIATNAPYSALVKDSDRQRFNVATSRARDQVFLFHSVKLDGIKNEECMRHKLLTWYLNPPLATMQAGLDELRTKAESEFEIEVGERIVRNGYRLIPQYRPFANDMKYRIDLVVQGENNRVAVECDGDRWHGPERWEYDQRREAQLRRAGWKFWRISGSSFYRDKESSLNSLWDFLQSQNIRPFSYSQYGNDGAAENHTKSETGPRDDDHRKSHAEEDRGSGDGSGKNSMTKRSMNGGKLADGQKSKQPIANSGFQVNSVPSKKGKIPSISLDAKVWFSMSTWVKETLSVNEFWSDFAHQIANALEKNRQISARDKENMKKLWVNVIRKGFKP
jgi:very-short-patch-repair endonuclease